MSFFNGASNMSFTGNGFNIFQGGVHQYQSSPSPATSHREGNGSVNVQGGLHVYQSPQSTPTTSQPEAPIKESISHVFQRTVVRKLEGFTPETAAFVGSTSQIVAISCKNPAAVIWDLDVSSDAPPSYYEPLMPKGEHSDPHFAKISADGSKAVVAPLFYGEGQTQNVRMLVWDCTKRITVSYEDSENIVDAAFWGNGSKMIVVSTKLRLLDMEKGVVTQIESDGGNTIALSADGKKLISAAQAFRKTLNSWDILNGRKIEFGSSLQRNYCDVHPSIVRAVALSPNGTSLALGFEPGKILLMDAETGEVTSKEDHYKGHTYWINQIVFSRDGKWFVSCSRDGSVRVWDAESGKPTSRPLNAHQGAVSSVSLSLDNRRIISVGEDGRVIVWTLQSQ